MFTYNPSADKSITWNGHFLKIMSDRWAPLDSKQFSACRLMLSIVLSNMSSVIHLTSAQMASFKSSMVWGWFG